MVSAKAKYLNYIQAFGHFCFNLRQFEVLRKWHPEQTCFMCLIFHENGTKVINRWEFRVKLLLCIIKNTLKIEQRNQEINTSKNDSQFVLEEKLVWMKKYAQTLKFPIWILQTNSVFDWTSLYKNAWILRCHHIFDRKIRNSIFWSNKSAKVRRGTKKGVTTEGKFHYENGKAKVKKQKEAIDWSFTASIFKSTARDQNKKL